MPARTSSELPSLRRFRRVNLLSASARSIESGEVELAPTVAVEVAKRKEPALHR